MTYATSRLEHTRSGQPDATLGVASEHSQSLTVVVAVVAMLAAALGLLLDGVYGTDEAATQMLRGFDVVTVIVIGPGLLLAVRSERHGSTMGRLVAASLLAYLGYTYVYYLLGIGFTKLMLLHVPLFTVTLVALVLTLKGFPISGLKGRLAGHGTRVAAGILSLLSVSLGVLWVYACLAYAVDGTLPAGSSLVESETVVHLGIVLDLTLLVPMYGAAAVLLWRRQPWGFVLASIALVAGTLHQVSYVVALLFQYAADVPGSVVLEPIEPVILLLYGIATALLLRHPGPVRPDENG